MALLRVEPYIIDSVEDFVFNSATVTSNVTAGNVRTDNLLYANGTPWAIGSSTYSNADAANYLPTFSGNLSAGNANLGNAVVANYFIGNGSLLTGLPASYTDTNANSAIDARVTKSFIDNLNVDADTLDGLNSTDFATSAQGTKADTALQAADVSTVATTGSYTDLLDTPTIFDGEYASLANAPFLATIATSGSYTHLIDAPTLGTAAATNANAYATAAQGTKADTALQPADLTGYATQSYVGNAVANLVASAPAALDTLNELANALGNDANYSTTITNALANKLSTTDFTSTANAWISTYSGNITANNLTITTQLTVPTIATTGEGGGNVYGVNNITANHFIGDGSLLTGLPPSYTDSDVETYLPNYAGNLSITNLTVSGSAILGNIANVTINGGTSGYVMITDGAGNLDWQAPVNSISTLVDVDVATVAPTAGQTLVWDNANSIWIPGNIFNQSTFETASANYLSAYTGNLSSANLLVTNSANLGNVANLKVAGGLPDYVLTTDGAGNLRWAATSSADIPSTSITVDTFIGDGTTTTFTLTSTPADVNETTVNYNGTVLLRSSYSLDGSDISFGSAPAAGSKLEVTTIQGVSKGTGSFISRDYVGDGTTVNYSVTAGTTVNSVLVTESGVVQTPVTDYTISGTTLTFAVAPTAGIAIQIRELAVATASGGSSNNTSIRAQAMTMGIIFGG